MKIICLENIEQMKDIKQYCNNKEQEQDVTRVCTELDKKGYRFFLNQNFLKNGVVITIKDNLQVEGEIIIFDNGNWIKDIYLKNKGLYHKGMVEINEDLYKISNGETYRITGELPINI